MYEHREDKACCYFHPKEVVVGVCPLCLNERLIILASEQQRKSSLRRSGRKPQIKLHKVFALGSLLNPFESRHRKSDNCGTDASTSHEDSFISIKFENNGVGSWEKGKVSKVSLEHCNNMSWNHSMIKEARGPTTVVEQAKPRGSSLRWQKRIGLLFHVMRWKRSNTGNVCHVGSKVEGVKVRNGWIRSLTKRRTKE